MKYCIVPYKKKPPILIKKKTKYIVIKYKHLDRLMSKGIIKPVVDLFFAIEEYKKNYNQYCGGNNG